MDDDRELEAWTSDWQSGTGRASSADAIRRYAQGRSRFMWRWAIAEMSVGVVALPLLAYLAWTATDAVERWAMGLLAVITIAAMGLGWWNWRGSLLASAHATAQFVSVSTERLRRMRQAWRIGWIVLAAEIAVFTVWLSNHLYGRAVPHTALAELFAWGWLATMSLSAVVFLLWLDRRIRRDAQKFEALKRELL